MDTPLTSDMSALDVSEGNELLFSVHTYICSVRSPSRRPLKQKQAHPRIQALCLAHMGMNSNNRTLNLSQVTERLGCKEMNEEIESNDKLYSYFPPSENVAKLPNPSTYIYSE